MQFGHDSSEQGAKELVRKAISLEDMEKIDSVRATTFVSGKENIFKEVTSGEICWYGHLADADIWLPFDYDTQMQMKVIKCVKIEKTFRIDEEVYYDRFEIRKNGDVTFSLKLSENLIINFEKRNFDFKLKSDLTQVMKDIHFLEAMRYGKTFYVGEHKVCEYTNLQLGDGLQQMIKKLKQLQLALIKLDIELNKDFKNFTDEDWKAVDELLCVYQGKIKPKNENTWYMWWWQGKVVPFFLIIDPNGELCIENGVCFKHIKISVGSEAEDERYIVPPFIMFKRDIWEKLYDVDEMLLLEELNRGEVSKVTEGDFTQLFIEILSAYDVVQDEKYYNVAKSISDRLVEIDPDAAYLKINKLQLIKRKRNLTEDEQQELERIESDTDDTKVACAANILLENKRKAKKKLDEMADQDKELFMTFPIYNLM